MAKQKVTTKKEYRGKKTRQGAGKLSKRHKKYRGQGGKRKRYKAQ